jgi:hypothetical protein
LLYALNAFRVGESGGHERVFALKVCYGVPANRPKTKECRKGKYGIE